MAGEPKRRHSKGRKRTRRAAIKLAAAFTICKNCGKPSQPHIVCVSCGFYGGKAVGKEKALPAGRQVQVTKV